MKHAYVPDIPGKERRKSAPSKAGTLGVEGMKPEVLLHALRAAGATVEGESAAPRGDIAPADLYRLGLSGGAGSAEKRRKLQRRLGLPAGMSAKALLEALNLLTTREELEALAMQI